MIDIDRGFFAVKTVMESNCYIFLNIGTSEPCVAQTHLLKNWLNASLY